MKILLLILVGVALVNSYPNYWLCSDLIPWHASQNNTDSIFCRNLVTYCQCMNLYYNQANINSVCIDACKSANCESLKNDLDCNTFFTSTDALSNNSGHGFNFNYISLLSLMIFLVGFN